MFKSAALLMALSLACGRPTTDLLRKQPSPLLTLELALPEATDPAAMKHAYLAAFQEGLGSGLAPSGTLPDAERIQLIVIVGGRTIRTQLEANLNAGVDMAGAVTSGSPLRVVQSSLRPDSAYEGQVQRLGYRPAEITGQIVLLKAGKDGFQESLRLTPMPILKHMRSLGESEREANGILAEEGRAVALETLALLKKKYGWEPPSQ